MLSEGLHGCESPGKAHVTEELVQEGSSHGFWSYLNLTRVEWTFTSIRYRLRLPRRFTYRPVISHSEIMFDLSLYKIAFIKTSI